MTISVHRPDVQNNPDGRPNEPTSNIVLAKIRIPRNARLMAAGNFTPEYLACHFPVIGDTLECLVYGASLENAGNIILATIQIMMRPVDRRRKYYLHVEKVTGLQGSFPRLVVRPGADERNLEWVSFLGTISDTTGSFTNNATIGLHCPTQQAKATTDEY